MRLIGASPRPDIQAVETDWANQQLHLLASDLGIRIGRGECRSLEKAQTWYLDALQFYCIQGNRIDGICRLTNLGNVARERFEFDKAQDNYRLLLN